MRTARRHAERPSDQVPDDRPDQGCENHLRVDHLGMNDAGADGLRDVKAEHRERDEVEESRKTFFVSGETAATDREAIRAIIEKQKNSITVASLGTFSTGINIRNLHNIVFASPSKSQIRVLQSIGRGLRKTDDNKDATLYDIIDDITWKSKKNFGILHADERLRIYGREKFNHKTYRVNL